ncbi:MAG TPA: hypothetical protein VJY62_22560 [Bacteroidia bacterium]|nr:hypothetical protein [Bacteroidia bacterium]
MKKKKLIQNVLVAMMIFIFFIMVEGCRKNMMDDSLSPSAIADINGMNDAYRNAKTFNDLLMAYSHDSSNQSNYAIDSYINQLTSQHDSALCDSLRILYDGMYHHYDSLFNYYHNLCHQQMGNHCSGNMMTGDMMNGGMMGGNSNSTNHCMINNTDYMSMMNSLHQLHSSYHP